MRISHLTDDPLHNVRFEDAIVARDIRPVQQPSALAWSYSNLVKRAKKCDKDDKSPRCEKPQQSQVLPIVLGTVIPLVCALGVLVWLHRRHMKKLRQEELADKTKSMDFGMGFGTDKNGQRKSKPVLDLEKSRSHRQMSMDGLHSPYIIPTARRGSHESLNSLAHAVHATMDDPYGISRPGTGHSHRPPPSFRGQSPHPQRMPSALSMDHRRESYGSSINEGPTVRSPDSSDSMHQDLLGNAQKMGQSTPPARSASLADSHIHAPEPAVVRPSPLAKPHLNIAHNQDTRDSYIDNDSGDLRRSHMHLISHINDSSSPRNSAQAPVKDSAPTIEIHEPRDSMPKAQKAPQINIRPMSDDSQYSDVRYSDASAQSLGFRFNVEEPKAVEEKPKKVEVEAPKEPEIHQPVPSRTTAANRDTLFVPGALDGRRLSMGARPLPSVGPEDSAEERADRIRSFYKEYFDESNNGQTPQGGYYEEEAFDDTPLPTAPANQGHYAPQDNRGYQNGPNNGYDYGYDQGYNNNGYNNGYNGYPQDTYYDDQYVQPVQRPYAEPVQRRAMTPPPRMNAGPRGPQSRAGSAASGRFPSPGPRSFSSASGRMNNGPRGAKSRPVPPPAPLNILPTPHALGENDILIPDMFAPPPTFKDSASGISIDPRGGQRPYSPTQRAHTPLASAFDELPSLPTPHALRKSSTFTGLDFAPPPRFRDQSDMSDAGSIRSNRSGRSQMTQQAVRAGAYRVSRIPVEVVPLKDDMTANLRPTMDIGRY